MKRLRPLVSCAIVLLSTCQLHAQRLLSFDPYDQRLCDRVTRDIWRGCDGPCFDEKTFEFECALRDQRIERAEFATLRKSLKKRGSEETTAYDRLIAAYKRFYTLHEKNEGEHGGTWAAVGTELDHAAMNHQFLLLMRSHESNGLPTRTANDFARADASLSHAYQALLRNQEACKPDAGPGLIIIAGLGGVDACVSVAELRKTELAWIRYRDAWLSFASLRWPDTSAEVWLTQLTSLRTKQLNDLAN